MNATEHQSAPELPERRWRWFCLRSLFIITSTFCVLLFVNTRPYASRPLGHVSTLDPTSPIWPGITIDGDDYGWPWTYKTEAFKTEVIHVDSLDRHYFGGLVADICFGLVLVLAVFGIMEWAVRRYG